jgi:pimeloyl-ACP methyl ester carboxylesterase
MSGAKAQALAAWAQQRGQGLLLFDYSGHGQSSGRFEDGTISAWLEDTLAAIDALTSGPLVLVGSSMGGWLSLLAARARPLRVKGLLLIAPATDFVTRLMIPSLPAQALAALAQEGRWAMPSAYASEPTVLTQALLDDGAGHCLLPGPIPFAGPVRILQGQEDPDVPWRHALDTAAAIASGDVRLTLVKDGDHRLSRPQDIALMLQEADQLCASLSA